MLYFNEHEKIKILKGKKNQININVRKFDYDDDNWISKLRQILLNAV